MTFKRFPETCRIAAESGRGADVAVRQVDLPRQETVQGVSRLRSHFAETDQGRTAERKRFAGCVQRLE